METDNRVAKNAIRIYAQMGVTVLIFLYVTRLIINALGQNNFDIFNRKVK